jgi:hypothetical protein
MARNLIMEVGEHAEAVTFLTRDQDTKFGPSAPRERDHGTADRQLPP